MSSILQQLDIFQLSPLLTNFSSKLSTVTEYNTRKQLLCLVSEDNDIVLRYTNESGLEVLKLVSWFRRTNRIIHNICFDPSGAWLLVLCFDNTLHIVPALAIVDKTYLDAEVINTGDNEHQSPFNINQVTSFIIPFVGPHECPDSKRCPNQQSEKHHLINKVCARSTNEDSNHNANGIVQFEERQRNDTSDIESICQDVPPEMLMPLTTTDSGEQLDDKTGNCQMMGTSFMASNTCPYPLSLVWWRTLDGLHRAIIGYSDGSICFVGLSPNCPFVANTAIETGSVVKLFICRDNTFDSVMLMITSSMKQQYKLLLEQRVIKYIYPGEMPTTPVQWSNDWQIIVPIQSISNTSEKADICSSQRNKEVCENNDNSTVSQLSTISLSPTSEPLSHTTTNTTSSIHEDASLSLINSTNQETAAYQESNSQLPPCHITHSITQSDQLSAHSDSKTQGQLYNDPTTSTTIDETNGKAGILPAARARLASLKSLGSKKLNAIKMRLSDNKQKLEECMSEHNFTSFTVMDSPSQTPELLTDSERSFYSLQNLRNTYLLSALHNHSNTLSVHNIDVKLKTLFQYKIPNDCIDILISSNILYAIQYVNLQEAGKMNDEIAASNENKNDVIKEKQALDKLEENLDLKQYETIMNSNECTSAVPSIVKNSEISPPGDKLGSNCINAVGVISSAMASARLKEDDKFNEASLLALFRFETETVLSLYQMATYPNCSNRTITALDEELPQNSSPKPNNYKDIRSPLDYVQYYENLDPKKEEFSLNQMEIMKTEFPKINYDPCYVITNKNVYYVQLKKEPFIVFLENALAGEWNQCRQFCNIFDLSFESCVEFVGDYLLRRRKVTQALVFYNTARIKPIRTALKLAMFSQTNALIHLCAMALKLSYVLKSKRFCHPIIKTLLPDITYRHSEDVRNILPPTYAMHDNNNLIVNEGLPCSDYKYGVDECLTNSQITPSSQFHLANLLLIALAEKAVNDKNYIPLWNFLVTNSKYHTNMTSIVLCQSGLFSAAVILAKMRGVCIDTFLALATVMGQEFGWYNELNVCLYNLSDHIFAETITYVPHAAVECFNFIQAKLTQIRPSVLKRLEQQLNPFSPIWRPVVSHTSNTHQSNNSNVQLLEFCGSLIETYLAVLIHLESQHVKYRDNIINALHTFRLTYEDNQFAIESSRFKPISAGCSHCACIVNGTAYFWGTNGIPCNYSVSKCADPPEPNYAVKSLDLLKQLNLEIHAVKCGRQHTLLLTNNGLYSFGNNNVLQLGIGEQMQAALQPMLVKNLDGKNITIVEAGQYHNAVVSDGLLYSWGWGVYGQLGHGTIENIGKPKVVEFFRKKKILQVSLGHAHSLVLCNSEDNASTDLYVFGSHHFGQLGLGNSLNETFNNLGSNDGKTNLKIGAGPNGPSPSVKCVLPQRLDFTTARLRLIHTKFFTNLVVDENGCLYTWGSSPQALRLANQIKRRANAKLKNEENQRREMNKWFSPVPSLNENLPICSETTDGTAVTPQLITENVNDGVIENVPILTLQIENDEKLLPLSEVDKPPEENNVIMYNETSSSNLTDFSSVNTTPITRRNDETLEEKKLVIREQGQDSDNVDETIDGNGVTTVKAPTVADVDNCIHMTPQQVDTSEIAGQIIELSTGLFHYALITSTSTLYTWGKNLEHQLGTVDKERRSVAKPSPLDNIEQAMHVECGADFTLVMTTDYVVKAFGGNSNGQCNRELGPTLDKWNKRLICMPASKRFMRYESQCVEVPVEINLPRPRITLDLKPTRYLKCIPTYQPHFIQEADINFDVNINYCAATISPSTPQEHYYKSTSATADSTDNIITCGQDSDDMISSLENLSHNDISSSELPFNIPLLGGSDDDLTEGNNVSSSYDEVTPEEQNYTQLLCTSQKNNIEILNKNRCENRESQRLPIPAPLISSNMTTTTGSTTTSNNSSNSNEKRFISHGDDIYMHNVVQHLRLYIHFCLYIFHGLYNANKIREFSSDRLEYRIRTLMLNFKFIDAFVICLQDVRTPLHALKLFEYFAKDTGYVPLRRPQLRYLIYHLFMHFIDHKYDLIECENFLLNDLEYYLLELAYVLYFNNNNTILEQNLNEKFKHLIVDASGNNDAYDNAVGTHHNMISEKGTSQISNDNNDDLMMASACMLNDTDVIFDNLSVKFKTIVCQYLLKHCEN